MSLSILEFRGIDFQIPVPPHAIPEQNGESEAELTSKVTAQTQIHKMIL